jgi:hypothetical protein
MDDFLEKVFDTMLVVVGLGDKHVNKNTVEDWE